ncbi:alginate lyase family protein [Rhizobium hainanense]|uniref:Poly(Beta-D-mannuronate) lyase n=1 Tax=Rhizobium hainanense TaxID=52131 RepID=A0A1C3VAP1_9HYPH|nr:alginate lyase family protein [Rhizobium hainanense]SCB24725.1 poly(beta-D-mannuronate) lyase [Rhizobium hainanense]
MSRSQDLFKKSVFLATLLMIANATQGQAAPTSHGPWDAPVSAGKTQMAFRCPMAPQLPSTLKVSDYYTDAAHSIIDPVRKQAYDQATRSLRSTARSVVDMADHYRSDGNEAEAACVASFLDGFATHEALSDSAATNQAVYVQGWMLGSFAVAWLKIRADDTIPNDERSRIAGWLADVASRNIAYYQPRSDKSDGRNNHRYWAGFTAMAAGIAANRKDLFDWGMDSFKIGASQIQSDGTLPLEMARRSRALHYHIFAAAPLVTLAEMASANGVDLYAVNDNALSRLMQSVVTGIDDPSFFAEKAGVKQETTPLHADDIAWATPFERRFPNPALAALLKKLTSRSVVYLGGLPAS